MSLKREIWRNSSVGLRLAVISMLLCGLLFPLAVTGFAQELFPNQANGSPAHFDGGKARVVGSYLIAQNFSRPWLFHSRNSTLSASGVDPDITQDDALGQVRRISNWTRIDPAELENLISQYTEGKFWTFGNAYVNVLRINLALVRNYQSVYQNLDPSLFVP